MSRYMIVNGELYNHDELRHYGVAGMKWGIRKAKKQGTTYSYTSRRQKRLTNKLAKAKSAGADKKKINKLNDKLTVQKKVDSNRERYARQTTIGGNIGKSLINGILGNRTYNNLRAAGYGKVGAWALNYLGGGLDIISGRSISRAFERSAAKRQIEMENEWRKKINKK